MGSSDTLVTPPLPPSFSPGLASEAERSEARQVEVSQRAAETNSKASEEVGQPHAHGAATRPDAEEPAREEAHQGPRNHKAPE